MSALREQLYDLGIAPGDVVLMHSSMKALGANQTPEGFLNELMSALTADGTLLLPALTYETVTPEQPFFSVTETEPCIGLLPKAFMNMDSVLRSLHPTHSASAWGAKSELLTCNHILDNTPVGPHSPFMLLEEHKGKILFVGDILHSCTFLHGIEEIIGTPYVMNKDKTEFTLKDAAGNIHIKEYYTHNFKGWNQEYARIREILTYPDIRTGTICAAPCTLINAQKLKTAVTERLKEDIYAFVSPACGLQG